VLTSVEQLSDKQYRLDESVRLRVEERVRAMCQRRPIGTYPATATATKAA